jgi:copper homeostasis protein
VPTIEVCIDNLDNALLAIRNGADQLEVCAELDQDGLTPGYDLVATLSKDTTIDLMVMIRNKPGDFHYSNDDIQIMLRQVNSFKSLRIKGFVLGATTVDSAGKTILDLATILQLCQACHPFSVTIHKCIDTCTDMLSECAKLKQIPNVGYILSSGGKATAWEGRDMLMAMKDKLSPEIEIIGAGKITKNNLATLDDYLHLPYYHGRSIVS